VLVLAADTSLPILSAALLRDGALLGCVALEGKSSRNEKLLPAIDWLLSESGADRRGIDLFAVTRGPGSFTGVRIGLATMQGLALALDKPLIAMSTHEAIAPDLGRVTIVDVAGRGEFYVSEFDEGREVVAPHLAKVAEGLSVPGYIERHNVAVDCARRALDIVARGDAERYRDVTPIYVRLAEAEARLQK
jgi:tRNA threonylcarbamoyladenosine biosynthesis protein TsaB